MKNNQNSSSGATSGGIGFTGLLQVAFIVLKLCKVIDWSWWWVWSPTWISIIVSIVILIGIWIFITWIDK